jgi:hypothetical protein
MRCRLFLGGGHRELDCVLFIWESPCQATPQPISLICTNRLPSIAMDPHSDRRSKSHSSRHTSRLAAQHTPPHKSVITRFPWLRHYDVGIVSLSYVGVVPEQLGARTNVKVSFSHTDCRAHAHDSPHNYTVPKVRLNNGC